MTGFVVTGLCGYYPKKPSWVDRQTMRRAATNTVEARGMTKPVALEVTVAMLPAGPKSTDSVTMKGTTTINRREF